MLQQTQVATVIPFFHRFLQRFPTLAHLADADEQAVLRVWEGLGYYRRARNLSRAARLLHGRGHRTLPDDPELVGSLPGFGRYTTNAVLSQAYGRALPIVEANSERVLCRLFGIAKSPKDGATKRRLWRLAEALLPSAAAGDFNQALMELGALVCTPTSPKCDRCPLSMLCEARQRNLQDSIPTRSARPKPILVNEIALVIRKRDRLLLVKRPDEGRWAGMWEFPHEPYKLPATPERAARELLRKLRLRGTVLGDLSTIRHSVTRFRVALSCLLVRHEAGELAKGPYADFAWVRPADLGRFPLATPQRKLAKLVAG
jgi:A/G-specific adenine glycosylase